MKWTVEKWINIGFAVALLILAATGLVSIRSTYHLIDANRSVGQGHRVLEKLESVFSLLKDMEAGERGYVITGNEDFLGSYYSADQVIEKEIGELTRLLAANPVQGKLMSELAPLIREKLKIQSGNIESRRREGFAVAQHLIQAETGKRKMDEIRQVVNRMAAEEERKLSRESKNAEQVAWITIAIITLGVIFALLVVVFVIWVTNRGMSERKRIYKDLRESEERYRRLVETMNDGLLVQSQDRFTYVNNRLCQMLGYDREEMIGRPLYDFLKETNQEIMAEQLARRSRGERKYYEIAWTGKSGNRVHTIVSPEPVFDDEGNYQGSFAVVTDIGERKQLEERLSEMSLHDELSGLYNRRGFLTLADQQLRMARRMKRKMFLLFIDLDRMKWINDTLGHQEGDRALQEVAHILKDTFRESDVIARIGGDEFVVLLLESSDSGTDICRRRLQEGLGASRAQGKFAPPLSVSVGITEFDPEHPVSLDELLSRADALMYEDKKDKRRI
ncbi:MAG: diguanylate cyclase [Proteobacteria bacterium]|nr:diguanylate cyclase [Pseudomonadota bacterium]